jgi:hypothetical protein
MSRAIIFLTAVILGLSSPALAGGKGGGGGGGQTASHTQTGPANAQTQQQPNMRKSGGDPKSSGKPYLQYRFGTVFTTK